MYVKRYEDHSCEIYMGALFHLIVLKFQAAKGIFP